MKKICPVLLGICGLAMSIGVNTVFKVCESSEKVMKCAYSSRVITIFGILIFLNSIFMIISNKKATNMTALINIIVLAIFAILIPAHIIGGCAKMMMACQQKAFPFTYAMSICIIVLCVLKLVVKRNPK